MQDAQKTVGHPGALNWLVGAQLRVQAGNAQSEIMQELRTVAVLETLSQAKLHGPLQPAEFFTLAGVHAQGLVEVVNHAGTIGLREGRLYDPERDGSATEWGQEISPRSHLVSLRSDGEKGLCEVSCA